jgi:hypothetical protein
MHGIRIVTQSNEDRRADIRMGSEFRHDIEGEPMFRHDDTRWQHYTDGTRALRLGAFHYPIDLPGRWKHEHVIAGADAAAGTAIAHESGWGIALG